MKKPALLRSRRVINPKCNLMKTLMRSRELNPEPIPIPEHSDIEVLRKPDRLKRITGGATTGDKTKIIKKRKPGKVYADMNYHE